MAQELLQHPPSEAALPRDKMNTDHRPLWGSLKRWFGKDDVVPSSPSTDDEVQRPGVVRRLSRKVVPGLPRPGTFKRQQSELRDNLEPIKPKPEERRTVSVDRKGYVQVRDLSRHGPTPIPRTSAPVLMETAEYAEYHPEAKEEALDTQLGELGALVQAPDDLPPDSASFADGGSVSADGFDDELLEELEKRWILNLSMHFRDRSSREKFFVTFAESPNRWRRVTISLDYREAPQGSLEEELQRTRFQRDKSARIYESIRDSLPDIQFYDTVTNLKLQTEHDRLHVHVTEDIHEVISYPLIVAISHLHCRRIREDELVFDSHLSGFVYKVRVNNEIFIKKEIPGPDTVEEFLYEINALHRLSGSDSVIQFGGVIIDNEEKLLKGLLISFAEKGALIDVIFDHKGELSWRRRERWARQIVQGLSEIHEAGFVQGDFTLSNIVIDAEDKAKIIDINRRGCPVGWEPPEVAALIESKQRISMYIGVKSDIFQLGMVLWAIAMEQDEPETQSRPLTLVDAPDEIPSYYRALVEICLSDDPRNRLHATVLLSMFPEIDDDIQPFYEGQATPDHEEAEYIDPETAVERDDIDNFRVLSTHSSEANGNPRSNTTHTYVNAPTDMSGEPYYYPSRGRSPSPRSLHDTEEPPYTQSHNDYSNGVHLLGEQSNDYFQPHIISVSPSRHHEFQGFEQDSILRSESVLEADFSRLTQDNQDDTNLGHVLAEPSSNYSEPYVHVMPEPLSAQQEDRAPLLEEQEDQVPPAEEHKHQVPPSEEPEHEVPLSEEHEHQASPLGQQEHQVVGQELKLHYTSLHELGDMPLNHGHGVHELEDNVPEEQPQFELQPHAILVPPSEPQETRSVKEDSTPHSKSDRIVGDTEKPRDTGAAPEPVPEVLAGIGEHSTIEHSDFPQGVLDDDLTNDTQGPSCIH